MKVKNVKELCELFWYLEDKYKLLDKDINEVKAWQIVRYRIFISLSEQFKLFEQAQTKLSIYSKMKKGITYFKNAIFKNPFFNNPCDILVLSHPRPVNVNNETIDIYTKYFIDEFKENNISYLELESPFFGTHNKSSINNTSFTDFFILVVGFISKFIKIRFTEDERDYINTINSHLSKSFEKKINITKILKQNIGKYKIKYFLYIKLLKKLKIKKVYLVVSYVNVDLVIAAKDLGIEVIEIQHGLFSKYHLGYSFPNRINELQCFPDKFFVWNDYWKNLITFPIETENIKVKKFDFLQNNVKKYENMKKLDQIVILSQGTVGNTLAQLIVDNLDIFKNVKIKYKLHPGEFDRYKEYPALQKLIKLHPDIEILKNTNLHKLLAKSKYQLGVNSTALFEGIEFKCETILFDTEGINHMHDFINFYNLKNIGQLYLTENTKKCLIG